MAAPTYFGSSTNPADNAAATDGSTLAVTPPASMQAGDLVLVYASLTGLNSGAITQSATGGQSWSTKHELIGTGSQGQSCFFWCEYNGTWSADPSWACSSQAGTTAYSVQMHVFRKPAGQSGAWTLEATRSGAGYNAPSTPFTVTVTGRTVTNNQSVSLAHWFSADDNTWGTLTGSGYVVSGLAQYRNTNGGSNTYAHLLLDVAAAAPNATKNQATLGGDPGHTSIVTLYVASNNKTLTAAGGSFAVTGTAATPKLGRKVSAAAGSFAFTGTAAALKVGHPLTAAAGSFAFAGTAASLKITHLLSASAGGYAFTGTVATLKHGWLLGAGSGSYAFTGSGVTLRRTYKLGAQAGGYSVTGTAASMVLGRRLSAGAGSYSVAGTAASLKTGRILSAAVGSYLFSGMAAALTVAADKRVIADSGSYIVTGAAAALILEHRLSADAGGYAFAGTSAGLRQGRRLSANAAAFAVSGRDASLRASRTLAAAPGSYLFAGTDAELKALRKLIAANAVYAWSGSDAGLIDSGTAPQPHAPIKTSRANTRIQDERGQPFTPSRSNAASGTRQGSTSGARSNTSSAVRSKQ